MKTIFYSNRIYLNQDQQQCLRNDIYLFHQMKVKAYRLVYHIQFNDLKVKSMQTIIKKMFGTNDYLRATLV
ncbi:hypothetical protein [Anaerorhabdus sp.]|uniref:hypothetical protein n=1 Tax=Anaerorhabdus sp. TaxID=1872524 RepID=UPI002FCA6A05